MSETLSFQTYNWNWISNGYSLLKRQQQKLKSKD